MALSYKLDPQAARNASKGGYIKRSGAYTGVITQAVAIIANSGAAGVELSFKAVTGAQANYITLYTHNAAGQHIFGFEQLCALMTCMKVKEINSTDTTLKKSDGTLVNVDAFPALINKPVGLVLQREEYKKKDGSIGEKMVFASAFDANTRQIAEEILDNKPAKLLEEILVDLQDKKPKLQKSKPAAPPQNMPPQDQDLAAFADEIPF